MTTITVQTYSQVINVDPATQAVTIIQAGPMGPPGVQGPPGSSNAPVAYLHTQVDLSSSWVINHNLLFLPSVDVYDTDGRSIEGHIIHHTINQVEVQLLTPRAGTARLS